MNLVNDPLSTFIFFFAVIDPIGTVPVFLAVTKDYDAKEQRKIAVRATAISAVILLFFIVLGELILTAMSIPLSAFQIAGGIVMFLFALSMIFGESKPDEELRLARTSEETAIFPLAVPSIAGPGAMLGAVLLTENSRYDFLEQVLTAAILLLVLLIVLFLMLGATRIHALIGRSGASIISRVMGLILSAVAASSVLAGIKQYFEL